MKASVALVKILKSEGVETIFALSGNQIMVLFDACLDEGVRIIHVRHEAAALYMAEAYARMTGQIGVALVTAGAGLCNAVAPLFTAAQSQTPVLLLSGDSEAELDGRGSFQEMDQVQVTSALTKFSERIKDNKKLIPIVLKAINLAKDGIPGPIHLAVAADILAENLQNGISGLRQVHKNAADAAEPSANLAKSIVSAKKPLIIVGPYFGMPCHGGKLKKLEKKLNIPVVLMESPRGFNDPRLGNIKSMIRLADLIIVVGKPIDFSLSYGSLKAFRQDAEWFVYTGSDKLLKKSRSNLGNRLKEGKNVAPLVAINMLQKLEHQKAIASKWLASFRKAIDCRDFCIPDKLDNQDRLNSLTFALTINKILSTRENVIAVSDGGEIGQWVQSFLSHYLVMVNGTSGAIGGSLSYALAIKLVHPKKDVLAFMGDGTIGFHLAEFETAVRENLPVIAVIGNDLKWNAEVKIQEQQFGLDRVYACELTDARYDKVAVALGGHGEYVTELKELSSAFQRSFSSGKPACINIRIEGLPAPSFANE
ncbi:MAG: thiamine pyrophosphate-binding protein [Rhodospirillaceae bacterium]|nr:thiamine pyrophosphate-binding protein [Rhodospirillaceae bacterium]